MNKKESLKLIKLAAKAADEKLGENIVALDVSKDSSLADYFLFVTGTTHVHIRSLEDAIRESLRGNGANLTRTDGQRGHVWRALDYGNVIIHIMDARTREYYAMEKLWQAGKPVAWSGPAKLSPKKAKKKKPAKKSSRRK